MTAHNASTLNQGTTQKLLRKILSWKNICNCIREHVLPCTLVEHMDIDVVPVTEMIDHGVHAWQAPAMTVRPGTVVAVSRMAASVNHVHPMLPPDVIDDSIVECSLVCSIVAVTTAVQLWLELVCARHALRACTQPLQSETVVISFLNRWPLARLMVLMAGVGAPGGGLILSTVDSIHWITPSTARWQARQPAGITQRMLIKRNRKK